MKTIITILLILITQQIAFSQWRKIDSPEKFQSFKIIFHHQNIIYGFGYNEQEIYISSDDGNSWDVLETNLNDFVDFGGFDEVLFHNNKFYMLSTANLNSNIYRNLYESLDNGKTWTKLTNFTKRSIQNIKFIDNELYGYQSHNIIKSSDLGKTWEKLRDGNDSLDYELIIKENEFIILGDEIADFDQTEKKGIMISTDNGVTWENKSFGLNGVGLTDIGKLGNTLLASSRGGIYKSTNLGDLWQLSNGGLSPKAIWINSIKIVGNVIYLATRGGVYMSQDSAKTWELVHPDLNNDITFFDYINGKFLISFSNENFKRYSVISDDAFLTLDTLNYKVSQHFTNYLEKDSNKYVSTDFGLYIKSKIDESYKLISNFFNDYNEYIRKFEKNDNILIAQLGSNDLIGTNYNETIISSDYGKSWQITDFGKEQKVKIVGYFINNEKVIYVLTENYGILYSTDLGLSWNNFEIKDSYAKSKLSSLIGYEPTGNYIIEDDSLYIFNNSSIIRTNFNLTSFEEVIDTTSNYYFDNLIYQKFKFISKYKNFFSAYSRTYNHYFVSFDYGKTWDLSNAEFSNKTEMTDLLQIAENIFAATGFGVYYSTNLEERGEKINGNLTKYEIGNLKTLYHYGNYLYLKTSKAFYKLDLIEDLNINISSVERRNALYHYPPYPQPSTTSVNIKTVWDSGVFNFTEDDIEIYNLNGEKIDTKGKLKLYKETENVGTIIWDNSNEEPGIYIVKTKHGTETLVTKIMIMK